MYLGLHNNWPTDERFWKLPAHFRLFLAILFQQLSAFQARIISAVHLGPSEQLGSENMRAYRIPSHSWELQGLRSRDLPSQ